MTSKDQDIEPLLPERYRFKRRLGNRGTILVEDRMAGSMGESVVLRRFTDENPTQEHKVALEGRLESSGLGLVRFSDGSLWVKRGFVDGDPLSERLRDGPLTPMETARLGSALLSALAQMHRRNVLHRNIHPKNVIVHGSPLQGGVLVDPALHTDDQGTSRDEKTAWKANYLSPESIGVIDRHINPASDMFSVGAVLFSTLTGDPPFKGTDLTEVLRSHLETPSVTLYGPGRNVPRALALILERLLRIEPDDRYCTSEGALADLVALTKGLEKGDPDPTVEIGSEDRRHTLTDPVFIGRESELDALFSSFQETVGGRSTYVHLAAESGVGKSWLMNEAGELFTQSHGWVISGQGLAQVATRPFTIFNGLRDALLERLSDDPGFLEDVRDALAEKVPVIVEVFPELAKILGHDGSVTGPEEFGVERTLDAMADLIDIVGSPEQPVVLLLDDVHWADQLSLRLLDHWWTRTRNRSGSGYTCIITAYRSEEIHPTHPLTNHTPDRIIRIRPFHHDEINRLVTSMAGPVPQAVKTAVARLSDGNAFLASAAVRGFVERGIMFHDGRSWQVEESTLSEMAATENIGEFLLRRLERLSRPTLTFLTSGAILGKEFDGSQAASLSTLSAEEKEEALKEAIQRRLLLHAEVHGRYVFVHDKLRESLLMRIGTEERKDLHLRIATRLKERAKTTAYDVAYHFHEGGDDEDAYPFAVEAAKDARSRYALSVAEQYYRIAVAGATQRPASERMALCQGLGEALMLDGRYEEAEEPFAHALQLAEEPKARAQVYAQRGELAFKRGDVVRSSNELEEALQALGKRPVRTRHAALVGMLWHLLVQVLHTLLPGRFNGTKGEMGDDRRLEIRIRSRLAYTYWFKRGAIACAWAHLSEMNLAERYTPGPELAQAYSEHGPVATILPHYRRGEEYVLRSRKIRMELGDPWGIAQSNHFLAVVKYSESEYQEALALAEEASRMFRRTGDRWEENTARWHTALCHYRMGELDRAAEIAREVYEAGKRLGDLQALGIGLGIWAKATEGDVPSDAVRSARERVVDDLHTGAEIAVADALLKVSEGDTAAAVAILEAAQKRIKRTGVRMEYVEPVKPWLATVLRKQIEALPAWAGRERRRSVVRHRKQAKAALRRARLYPNNLPHALREHAWAHTFKGHVSKAIEAFDQSIEIAKSQGARYEEALSIQDRALYEESLGEPNAREEHIHAKALVNELRVGPNQGPRTTLSLVDRFTTLIERGREIVSSFEPTSVYAEMEKAALAILRGDRVAVHRVDNEGRAQRVAGKRGPLNMEALQPYLIGQEVVSLDPDASLEILPWVCRSAIVAPVIVRGKAEAVLVVGHTKIDDLFTDEDRHLAAFLARLAGAALENASSIAELKEKSMHLAQQKSILEAQSEASNDGILVVDNQGAIISYNQRFISIWKIPQEVVDMGSDERAIQYVLDQVEDPDAFLARIEHLYSHPQEESTDELKLRGGRILSRYSKCVIGEDGTVFGRVWFFRDITQARRQEERLRTAYSQLKEVDRLKNDFINMAAHELNTPMTPLQIQVHLLKDRTARSDPSIKNSVAIIERNLDRLKELAGDLLDSARLQGGRYEVRPRRVDLAKVLTETLDTFDMIAKDKGLAFTYKLPPRIEAHTDPDRLLQVVQNLVTNAIKFTPSGGKISFTSQRTDDRLMMEAQDTGIGLTETDLQDLFKPFMQLSHKESWKEKGSGLGLYICKGIVERLGGTIEATSPGPDKGSKFRITIPLNIHNHVETQTGKGATDQPATRTKAEQFPTRNQPDRNGDQPDRNGDQPFVDRQQDTLS